MGYNQSLKLKLNLMGHSLARPGGGGPMVNPRAPGTRTALMFPPSPSGFVGLKRPIWNGTFNTYRGDPGIFGAIGKVIGKVAKGVGKAALGVAGSVIKATPAGQIVSSIVGAVSPRIGAPQSRTIPSSGLAGPNVLPNPFGQPGQPYDFGGPPEQPPPTVVTGGTMPGTSVALCAPSGYHLNKSGYWKSDSDLLPGASWHPKGTVLVKNRKRNPFNPHAASRAMARLGSLYAAMKVLDKQMAKVARGAGVHRSTRHSGKCGCAAGRKGK